MSPQASLYCLIFANTNIAILREDASEAETEENWDLAEQLWKRVLAASRGTDTKAVQGIQRIAIKRSLRNYVPFLTHQNSCDRTQ